MPLSRELEEHIAHYIKVANQYREQAEAPEYARLKNHLLDLATEWARLAETTAKGAEAGANAVTP